MDSGFIDFINLVFRFVHIVAAIMWIGNSLLFTWMEINLLEDKKNPHSLGSMNMLHGGGIFFLEKRVIKPEEIPRRLHIFKWQSYTTWLSGFILLVGLFYIRGETLLVDPSKTDISGLTAAGISFVSLLVGWLFYDLIWRSKLKDVPALGIVICFTALLVYGGWLDTLFNGRAVYLQMGAVMGTVMSANVFFHIMPNQDQMMAALRAGKPHDLNLGKQAKIRSWHNHFMTFPVIFLMLSAHFPVTYGSERKIAIAAVIMVALSIIKHLMNSYRTKRLWKQNIGVTFILGGGLVYLLITLPPIFSEDAGLAVQLSPEVEAGRRVFTAKGCQACHLPVTGTIAPSLHGLMGREREFADGTKLMADVAYVRESILNPNAKVVRGFVPAMPPYETVISEEELNQMVAYIQSISD